MKSLPFGLSRMAIPCNRSYTMLDATNPSLFAAKVSLSWPSAVGLMCLLIVGLVISIILLKGQWSLSRRFLVRLVPVWVLCSCLFWAAALLCVLVIIGVLRASGLT